MYRRVANRGMARLVVWPRNGDIDYTNQEGRTRSGINTSASPDPSAHEGLDWHKC